MIASILIVIASLNLASKMFDFRVVYVVVLVFVVAVVGCWLLVIVVLVS
jgi:hypothetical protein